MGMMGLCMETLYIQIQFQTRGHSQEEQTAIRHLPLIFQFISNSCTLFPIMPYLHKVTFGHPNTQNLCKWVPQHNFWTQGQKGQIWGHWVHFCTHGVKKLLNFYLLAKTMYRNVFWTLVMMLISYKYTVLAGLSLVSMGTASL